MWMKISEENEKILERLATYANKLKNVIVRT
jgi:hypothetical protein